MRTLRNERGAVIVLYAVAMVAILGMAALAIDLGMLRKSKAEAQRAADAAALAGASAFPDDWGATETIDTAFARAIVAAQANYMNGVSFDATSGGLASGLTYTSAELTVTVFPEELPPRVWVKVRRSAVETWFAQIFGINTLPVGATAAAVADWASGTNCVKPIALADAWGDAGDVNEDHYPNAGESWVFGEDPQPDVYQPADYDPAVDGSGTGYGSTYRDPATRDWGLQIMLRPDVIGSETSDPCLGTLAGKCYYPGWWGLWGPPPGPGAADVKAQFKACTALAPSSSWNDSTYTIGTEYESQTGWTSVDKTVQDIYNLDQGARWDPAATDALTGKPGTVVGSSFGSNWRSSPRTWIVAVFDPATMPSASEDISFNNFMMIFFEGCMDATGVFTSPIDCSANNSRVVARFLGKANGTATGPDPGTMIRILRLVE